MSVITDVCEVCSRINPNLTHVENAEVIGVSESAIRRHRKAKHSPFAVEVEDDPFFPGVPREVITSRGKSIRTAYGWEKITYSPAKAAILEARKFDDLKELIDAAATKPPKPTRAHDESTMIVSMADLQIGKVDMHGGTPETIERVFDAVNRIAEKIKRVNPLEVVLVDAGDIIENFENTGKQAQTNDIPLTEQIRTARYIFGRVITMLAPLTPRLTVVSVPSNHCQVRKDREAVNFPNDDFGLDINHTLEERFSDNPAYSHVAFVRPSDPFAEALTYTTQDGTKVGFVHGHQANNVAGLDKWWTGQSHGRRNGLHEADILIVGHFHSFHSIPSGDDRRIFVCPSMDNGSSWFTNSTGATSTPGMLTLRVHKGTWNDVELF